MGECPLDALAPNFVLDERDFGGGIPLPAAGGLGQDQPRRDG